MSVPKSWLLWAEVASWQSNSYSSAGGEDVDAHRREAHVGISRHGRRVGGLLDEVDHALFLIDVHDAEAVAVGPGTGRQPMVMSAWRSM